ncbi:MAG TPA: type II secretion system minor pseudopilin GspK [Noviherbaspirillum sp.]|jgi:general secretion pathway protein K|uniref:type II secretion system minor pseudopilin GspK n=1 Tax=Noviherbaspirillum sp. TaxID=1926288 RepID=UPI002F922069
MRTRLSRQRGVAVITALLLTTLAITIVASLFWQQQVQVRSIENQRLQLQKQWILRGALDWSSLILREDKIVDTRGGKPGIDHLGEPWAVPLAETRLDQYVDNPQAAGDMPDAALSGGIVDATSRYNLGNLVKGGQLQPEEVAVFGRLLGFLQLNPSLAQAAANLMQSAAASAGAGGTGTGAPASTPGAGSGSQPLKMMQVEDLLAVPGFTPEAVEKLKNYVVFIPLQPSQEGNKPVPINVNTAPAEVIAARIATLPLSEATSVVAKRQNAAFSDVQSFVTALGRQSLSSTGLAVSTDYFLINGIVRLNRAGMEMQAMIDRGGLNARKPKVLWIRQN